MSRLFPKRFRIALQPRRTCDGLPVVLALDARTLSAARRAATERHPDHFITSVERIDEAPPTRAAPRRQRLRR